MTNCIFYSVIFSLFITVTFGSLRYSQINRTFMSTYKGMFEACTLSVDQKGEPVKPYYDAKALSECIKNYVEPNIEKYTNDYHLSIEYESNSQYLVLYPRRVTLTLTAKINMFFSYFKEQTLQIVGRDEL